MRTRRFPVIGALLVLAVGCHEASEVGRASAALDEVPPPPPLPDGEAEDAGTPPPPCEAGSEYDSYRCCMEIVGDAAYCHAMEPPLDLGEAAPAQIGDSFPAAEGPPPPTTGTPPNHNLAACDEPDAPEDCEELDEETGTGGD